MGETRTGKPTGDHGCSSKSKRSGEMCNAPAVRGTDKCHIHAGKSLAKLKAEGAVRVEVQQWGLGDSTVDPGEILLRLVTQSAIRVEKYGQLLEEAYAAAEQIKASGGAGQVDPGLTETALLDLKRALNDGGVTALIGHTYAANRDGDVFATGEAIRGLAQLEAAERDRCANFATKAVAAGLAERQVRLAEKQGAMIAQVIKAILDDLGLTADQQQRAPEIAARHLRSVA